jgi:hypothetical protein
VKIVVIGGTGPIGSKTVAIRARGPRGRCGLATKRPVAEVIGEPTNPRSIPQLNPAAEQGRAASWE